MSRDVMLAIKASDVAIFDMAAERLLALVRLTQLACS